MLQEPNVSILYIKACKSAPSIFLYIIVPVCSCFRLVHRAYYSIGEQQQLPDNAKVWLICIRWLFRTACTEELTCELLHVACWSPRPASYQHLHTVAERSNSYIRYTWKMIQWLMMLGRRWWLTANFAVINVCIPSVSRTHNWIKVGCCALEKT